MTVAFDIDKTLLDDNLEPIEDTVELMRSYYNNGYKIVIITARHKMFSSTAKNHLRAIDGIEDIIDLDNDIYYSNGGTKVPILHDLNVEIFFDDLVYNMYDIIKNIRFLHPNFKLYQIVHKDNKYMIFDTMNKYIYS